MSRRLVALLSFVPAAQAKRRASAARWSVVDPQQHCRHARGWISTAARDLYGTVLDRCDDHEIGVRPDGWECLGSGEGALCVETQGLDIAQLAGNKVLLQYYRRVRGVLTT